MSTGFSLFRDNYNYYEIEPIFANTSLVRNLWSNNNDMCGEEEHMQTDQINYQPSGFMFEQTINNNNTYNQTSCDTHSQIPDINNMFKHLSGSRMYDQPSNHYIWGQTTDPNKTDNTKKPRPKKPAVRFTISSTPPPALPPITYTDTPNNSPDDELLKEILGFNDSETTDVNGEKLCSNPLCDHLDNSPLEIKHVELSEFRSIQDVIELGKTYHCKKNTLYKGINLRIICNLVEPLTHLQNLIGMRSVKDSILNQIIFFLQGFNSGNKCNVCIDCIYNLPCIKAANHDMLHTVITGPPGVGKTELGKILGEVYRGMGILKTGKMKIVTRSDLIGKYLGHTAAKTQAVIDDCRGGILFIDEAYSLGSSERRDSFSKECLDTLNQNLSERRDTLVIIAGYKDALDSCFFSQNEGLRRRFTFQYNIENYTPEELMQIFLLKIKLDNWNIEFGMKDEDTPEEKSKKINKQIEFFSFFKDNIKYFVHFGGDIETLFLNCKMIHSRRTLFLDQNHKKVLSMHDITKGFDVFLSNRKYKDQDERNAMSTSVQMMYL
jgi:hypothetical protein